MNVDNLFPTEAEPQDLHPTNLEDLLLCNDREFIESAYRLILMRRADDGGLQFYLARLRSGVGKVQILAELSTSDEARVRGAVVQGLRSRLRRQQLESVPLLGPIFGFLSRVAGDSKATVRMRAIEWQTRGLNNALSRVIHREKQLEKEQLLLRQSLEDARRRQEAFETQQLPTLLQTLSDLNHRRLANDNLLKSVPVALRTITRDAAEMRSMHEALSRTIERQLAQIETALGSIQSNISNLESVSEQRFNETAPQLKMLMGDVGYLSGRVEFVRRELMFEMRYSASTPSDEPERLKAQTAIVSPEKLAIARKTEIRLNLGCGHICLGGYLNVDRRRLPGVDIVTEVDDLPFEAGDVTEIRSAHLIEHFPQEQLRRTLLPYWFGLLRPGGGFSVIAPDAQAMMTTYVAGEYPFEQVREVTFGGQDYDGDFHYNMLTTGSVTKLLEEAGFVDVRIVAENRVNGACKEFEIAARRPSANA
jgi:predicted SAM-dependent methyltransferase